MEGITMFFDEYGKGILVVESNSPTVRIKHILPVEMTTDGGFKPV